MGSLRILIFFGLIGLISAEDATEDTTEDASVNEYLDQKLRQSKQEIAKISVEETPAVKIKSYDVQWERLKNQTMRKERPFLINNFDKILVLENNHIIVLSTDMNSENIAFALEDVNLVRRDNIIKFVRSIAWKGILYLLVCFEKGYCNLYTGTDKLELRNRQTIKQRGVPMDASFFTRANRLYLVVADNSGEFVVPSVIYYWRGTYMDVIAQAMTTAAVSVTTFNNKKSTIIIFAQNDKNLPKIGSVVYEFKETSLEGIQFLPTIGPASLNHYQYDGYNFVFLTNEINPSSLFLWDGIELLNWLPLPEITAPSLLHVVDINGETFFFVGYDSIVQLYKVQSASNCTLLGALRVKDDIKVVDLRVNIDESAMIMILITRNANGVYSVEQWEIIIKEASHEGLTQEMDYPGKCLSGLVEMLHGRMLAVDQAESIWALLLTSAENRRVSEPIALSNILFESGTVDRIGVHATEGIISPRKIRNELDALTRKVDQLVSTSRNRLSLVNDITVTGDAFIDVLHVDTISLHFLNTIDVRAIDIAPARKARQVDSLCGLPAQYWAVKNDTSKIILNAYYDDVEFTEDSIIVHSDVSLENFKINNLNNISIEKFFEELFILGKDQIIKGDITFTNTLGTEYLSIRTLNRELLEKFMTTVKDQSFGKFITKSILVGRVYADSINDVPVSEAARFSRANIIKGEVRVARGLEVTEELTIEAEFKLSDVTPLQIYETVTVQGNLKTGDIKLEDTVEVFINDKRINFERIFENFWSGSVAQTIKAKVTFDNEYIVIDRLNGKYINGLSENEFLYNTVKEIGENFANLHLENLHVNDSIFLEADNASIFDVAPDSITIRAALHLEHLHVTDLLVDIFNNVHVNHILSDKRPLKFSGNINCSTIRGKTVSVNEINFHFLKDQDASSFLYSPSRTNEDIPIDHSAILKWNVKNLFVDRINGIDVRNLDSLKSIREFDFKNLIIAGDLTVTENFITERIDNQPIEIYLETMGKQDILLKREELIADFTVRNLTLNLLHGRKMEIFLKNLISKRNEQYLPGEVSFDRISADTAITEFINDEDSTKLIWTDEPFALTGNTTFHDLVIEGDIITDSLNNGDINEFYENLLTIPLEDVDDLSIHGKIIWEKNSSDIMSLTYLLDNSVTKFTGQILYGDTIFQTNTSISILRGDLKESDEIRSIIWDSVIDDQPAIRVTGKKIFQNNLIVNTLSVTGDLTIDTINNVNIPELNNSIVRKYQADTISGHIIFLEEVTINEMVVDDNVHGASLSGLFLLNNTVSNNLIFGNLIVSENVFLENLDGEEFNEFLSNRVTLNGHREISADVQFNGLVEVTGNATATKINGIRLSDVALNHVEEMQFVSGTKTFETDLVVNGKIYAPFLNNIDITSKYKDGIQNDENVEIYGDLIFESKVQISKNGINLIENYTDGGGSAREILRNIEQDEDIVDQKIIHASRTSESLTRSLLYFETEEKLKVQVPNIQKVDVVNFELTTEYTKLNMYGEEDGVNCGLPRHCTCPVEYVAEFTKNECNIRKMNNSLIVRNFHEINGIFGINVISNTISSRRECMSNNPQDEFTMISWMKPKLTETGDVVGNVEEMAVKAQGFIKDAQVLSYNDEVFIILAVYYDIVNLMHQTNSVVYKLDIERNQLSLYQNISTDGASSLEIFRAQRYDDLYIIIGCFGTRSESLLYRFDKASYKLVLVRTFRTRSRYTESLSQENDYFVMLDDFKTRAVEIYKYDHRYDNFYIYQSLFHRSIITGIECFHSDAFAQSDSYVIVTTEEGQFYVYEYMLAQQFRIKVKYWIEDLQTMLPFHRSNRRYIFAGTKSNSTILRIV